MTHKANPELYRQLNQPFESEDKATEHVTAFFQAVEIAREQFRIPNVSMCVQVVMPHNGKEVIANSVLMLGDPAYHEAMMLYAAHKARKDYLAAIGVPHE